MANLNPGGSTKDTCDRGNGFRLAVLSRIVALALLTPLVAYFFEDGDSWVRAVIRDYYHSELFVFLVGCVIIASVEALAWLARWAFTNGGFNHLIKRCS